MLRVFRSSRSAAALSIALCAMVLLCTVDWWHVYDADAESPAFHDHASHRVVIKATHSTTERPAHCYLCHWLRGFGHGVRTSPSHTAGIAISRYLYTPSPDAIRNIVVSLIPARAPPL